jgi:preprotein translocase subunit YajC
MIGASSGGASFFLIIIIAFLVLWLLVVRPQKRRQNEQQRMLGGLEIGDRVLTAGGIYGTITRIEEDEITVLIAPQLEVQVARRAIAGVTRDEPELAEAGTEPAAGEPLAAEPGAEDPDRVTSGEENRG